jgi:hypothetical protein
MPLNSETRKALASANQLEASGEHGKAEKLYLDIIRNLHESDRAIIGAIHINLGTNAEAAQRPDDALQFWLKAIQYLQGEKGEHILQRAHAYYNTARVYLSRNDSKAVLHAQKALDDYGHYPFTSPVNVADATAVQILAKMFITKSLEQHALRDAWNTIRQASGAAMNYELLFNFLVNYLVFQRRLGADQYERAVAEVSDWAPAEVGDEVFKFVATHG